MLVMSIDIACLWIEATNSTGGLSVVGPPLFLLVHGSVKGVLLVFVCSHSNVTVGPQATAVWGPRTAFWFEYGDY